MPGLAPSLLEQVLETARDCPHLDRRITVAVDVACINCFRSLLSRLLEEERASWTAAIIAVRQALSRPAAPAEQETKTP